VQGIVRGHRGLIRVSSEPGRGTTFKVYLPALAGSIRPDPEQPPLATVRSGTILVVDDEPAVREFLRAALEHGKHKVFEAEDGVAGVDLFRARADEIDLVILDLTMPRLSGDKALEQLRAIREHTPIVLSSGYTDVEAAHRLRGHGGVEFLQKPYTLRELLALVARMI
jgi:DNA-binding response OmpR family regulator